MQKIETGISELLKRQPVTEQEKDAYIQELQKAMRLLLEEVRDLEEMVALLQVSLLFQVLIFVSHC